MKYYLLIQENKTLKSKLQFFYLLIDASFKINLIRFMKLIPIYADISGTKDSFVIPG